MHLRPEFQDFVTRSTGGGVHPRQVQEEALNFSAPMDANEQESFEAVVCGVGNANVIDHEALKSLDPARALEAREAVQQRWDAALSGLPPAAVKAASRLLVRATAEAGFNLLFGAAWVEAEGLLGIEIHPQAANHYRTLDSARAEAVLAGDEQVASLRGGFARPEAGLLLARSGTLYVDSVEGVAWLDQGPRGTA
ncbi:MAG: hypothetical protein AB1758_16290 [Candidatus Eremiobacterota bacterium]